MWKENWSNDKTWAEFLAFLDEQDELTFSVQKTGISQLKEFFDVYFHDAVFAAVQSNGNSAEDGWTLAHVANALYYLAIEKGAALETEFPPTDRFMLFFDNLRNKPLLTSNEARRLWIARIAVALYLNWYPNLLQWKLDGPELAEHLEFLLGYRELGWRCATYERKGLITLLEDGFNTDPCESKLRKSRIPVFGPEVCFPNGVGPSTYVKFQAESPPGCDFFTANKVDLPQGTLFTPAGSDESCEPWFEASAEFASAESLYSIGDVFSAPYWQFKQLSDNGWAQPPGWDGPYVAHLALPQYNPIRDAFKAARMFNSLGLKTTWKEQAESMLDWAAERFAHDKSAVENYFRRWFLPQEYPFGMIGIQWRAANRKTISGVLECFNEDGELGDKVSQFNSFVSACAAQWLADVPLFCNSISGSAFNCGQSLSPVTQLGFEGCTYGGSLLVHLLSMLNIPCAMFGWNIAPGQLGWGSTWGKHTGLWVGTRFSRHMDELGSTASFKAKAVLIERQKLEEFFLYKQIPGSTLHEWYEHICFLGQNCQSFAAPASQDLVEFFRLIDLLPYDQYQLYGDTMVWNAQGVHTSAAEKWCLEHLIMDLVWGPWVETARTQSVKDMMMSLQATDEYSSPLYACAIAVQNAFKKWEDDVAGQAPLGISGCDKAEALFSKSPQEQEGCNFVTERMKECLPWTACPPSHDNPSCLGFDEFPLDWKNPQTAVLALRRLLACEDVETNIAELRTQYGNALAMSNNPAMNNGNDLLVSVPWKLGSVGADTDGGYTLDAFSAVKYADVTKKYEEASECEAVPTDVLNQCECIQVTLGYVDDNGKIVRSLGSQWYLAVRTQDDTGQELPMAAFWLGACRTTLRAVQYKHKTGTFPEEFGEPELLDWLKQADGQAAPQQSHWVQIPLAETPAGVSLCGEAPAEPGNGETPVEWPWDNGIVWDGYLWTVNSDKSILYCLRDLIQYIIDHPEIDTNIDELVETIVGPVGAGESKKLLLSPSHRYAQDAVFKNDVSDWTARWGCPDGNWPRHLYVFAAQEAEVDSSWDDVYPLLIKGESSVVNPLVDLYYEIMDTLSGTATDVNLLFSFLNPVKLALGPSYEILTQEAEDFADWRITPPGESPRCVEILKGPGWKLQTTCTNIVKPWTYGIDTPEFKWNLIDDGSIMYCLQALLQHMIDNYPSNINELVTIFGGPAGESGDRRIHLAPHWEYFLSDADVTKWKTDEVEGWGCKGIQCGQGSCSTQWTRAVRVVATRLADGTSWVNVDHREFSWLLLGAPESNPTDPCFDLYLSIMHALTGETDPNVHTAVKETFVSFPETVKAGLGPTFSGGIDSANGFLKWAFPDMPATSRTIEVLLTGIVPIVTDCARVVRPWTYGVQVKDFFWNFPNDKSIMYCLRNLLALILQNYDTNIDELIERHWIDKNPTGPKVVYLAPHHWFAVSEVDVTDWLDENDCPPKSKWDRGIGVSLSLEASPAVPATKEDFKLTRRTLLVAGDLHGYWAEYMAIMKSLAVLGADDAQVPPPETKYYYSEFPIWVKPTLGRYLDHDKMDGAQSFGEWRNGLEDIAGDLLPRTVAVAQSEDFATKTTCIGLLGLSPGNDPWEKIKLLGAPCVETESPLMCLKHLLNTIVKETNNNSAELARLIQGSWEEASTPGKEIWLAPYNIFNVDFLVEDWKHFYACNGQEANQWSRGIRVRVWKNKNLPDDDETMVLLVEDSPLVDLYYELMGSIGSIASPFVANKFSELPLWFRIKYLCVNGVIDNAQTWTAWGKKHSFPILAGSTAQNSCPCSPLVHDPWQDTASSCPVFDPFKQDFISYLHSLLLYMAANFCVNLMEVAQAVLGPLQPTDHFWLSPDNNHHVTDQQLLSALQENGLPTQSGYAAIRVIAGSEKGTGAQHLLLVHPDYSDRVQRYLTLINTLKPSGAETISEDFGDIPGWLRHIYNAAGIYPPLKLHDFSPAVGSFVGGAENWTDWRLLHAALVPVGDPWELIQAGPFWECVPLRPWVEWPAIPQDAGSPLSCLSKLLQYIIASPEVETNLQEIEDALTGQSSMGVGLFLAPHPLFNTVPPPDDNKFRIGILVGKLKDAQPTSMVLEVQPPDNEAVVLYGQLVLSLSGEAVDPLKIPSSFSQLPLWFRARYMFPGSTFDGAGNWTEWFKLNAVYTWK